MSHSSSSELALSSVEWEQALSAVEWANFYDNEDDSERDRINSYQFAHVRDKRAIETLSIRFFVTSGELPAFLGVRPVYMNEDNENVQQLLSEARSGNHASMGRLAAGRHRPGAIVSVRISHHPQS